MDGLLRFLNRLEEHHIKYVLERNHEDAVMVILAVPGERWEIEFFTDGTVEVEKFVSTGVVRGDSAIEELFRVHAR